MSKAVFKIPLQKEPCRQAFPLPKGAEFLHLQMQFDQPCAWFLIDPEQPLTTYVVTAIPTGTVFDFKEIDKDCFIGTALMLQGSFVLHYFIQEDATVDLEPEKPKRPQLSVVGE